GRRVPAEVTPRRFPPPWSVEDTNACFMVRDARGQVLAPSISRTPVLYGRGVDARGSSVRDCGCYGCDRPVAVRGRTVFRKRNQHLVRCQWRLADRFGWRPVVEGFRRTLLGLRRRLNDANDLKRDRPDVPRAPPLLT